MLKTSGCALGFQNLPRNPANVNARKNMFDPYIVFICCCFAFVVVVVVLFFHCYFYYVLFCVLFSKTKQKRTIYSY